MTALSSCRFVAVVAGLSLALVGCAVSKVPEPVPLPPVVRETPTPTPPSAPAPEPAVPTTCDELLPPAVLQGYDPRIAMHGQGDIAEGQLENMLGPKAMATLRSGEQQLYCTFGIPQTDGGASIGVAIISEETRDELLLALRSSVFSEVDAGMADAAFMRGASESHQHTATIIIDEDALVALTSRLGTGFAWDAYEKVRGQE